MHARTEDQGPVDAMEALRQIHRRMEETKMRTIDLFRLLDRSGDGTITRSELRKGLEEIGVNIDPASFKALVGHLDRDSGGTINLKEMDRGIKEAVREKYGKDVMIDPAHFIEYELLMEVNRALHAGTQMIFGNRVTDSRSFFRAIDRDNSGELDASELAKGLLKLGIQVTNEGLMHDLVDSIDKNSSGLIDREEFVKALQNPEELFALPEAKPKKERAPVEPGREEDATKVLAAMHEHLSNSKTRTVDWFRKMDTSGDGKVSRAELKRGLKEMGCALTASELLAIINYLDKDSSGAVSLQELQRGMNAAVRAVAAAAGALEPVVEGPAANAFEALVQINAALRSNTQLIMGTRVTDARSFFKAMDKDDSGSLDKTEVARGLKRLGIEASPDLLDQIVAAIDVNNDGVLEMKELVRALKDPREAAPPTASAASGGPGAESPGADVEATEPLAAARSLSPLREARDAAAPLETSVPTENAEEAPGPAPESPDALMMAAPAAPADSVPSQNDSKESAQEPASSSSIMPDAPAEAETVQPSSQASSPASPSRKSRVTVQGNDRNERKSVVASRTGTRPSMSPTKRASRAAPSSTTATPPRRSTRPDTQPLLNRGSPRPGDKRASALRTPQ